MFVIHCSKYNNELPKGVHGPNFGITELHKIYSWIPTSAHYVNKDVLQKLTFRTWYAKIDLIIDDHVRGSNNFKIRTGCPITFVTIRLSYFPRSHWVQVYAIYNFKASSIPDLSVQKYFYTGCMLPQDERKRVEMGSRAGFLLLRAFGMERKLPQLRKSSGWRWAKFNGIFRIMTCRLEHKLCFQAMSIWKPKKLWNHHNLAWRDFFRTGMGHGT